MISSWAIYTHTSSYAQCALLYFCHNNYLLSGIVHSSCKKLHICTYHNIGRCGENMYNMRSVDVMTICMYHMTTMGSVVNLFGLPQSCKLADRNYFSLSAW